MQDNSLSNAHMRLCHLLPRVKRRHGKLAQDSWELWSLSAYFVAGAVERHKVTGFVRDFRGVQLVLNQTRLAAIRFMILWKLGPTVVSRAPQKNLCPARHESAVTPLQSQYVKQRNPRWKVRVQAGSKMPRSTSKYAESLVRLHPAFRKLSKKNGPITCEQLRRASTLHRVHRHRSSQRLYKRLTVDPQSTAFLYKLQSAPDRLPVTSVTSSSCWESSVPCRPDLPPSLRNLEVDASTWSHASVRSMYAAIMVYIVCVLFNYIYNLIYIYIYSSLAKTYARLL